MVFRLDPPRSTESSGDDLRRRRAVDGSRFTFNSSEAARGQDAAGRMRKLLADVPSITRDNVSSAEVCDIREVIAAASEPALAAKEAMPGGGTVRIGARKTGTSVLVEFEDTGPGIPACIYDRLFEPFVTSGKGRPGTWTLASPSEGSQLRLRFVD
jgi:hypothetical protein